MESSKTMDKSSKSNSRTPRSRFSPEAILYLEQQFNKNPYPNSESKQKFSDNLGVSMKKVDCWFKNCRMMAARKKHKLTVVKIDNENYDVKIEYNNAGSENDSLNEDCLQLGEYLQEIDKKIEKAKTPSPEGTTIKGKQLSKAQIKFLDEQFKTNPYPDGLTRKLIAKQINSEYKRVSKWFANRRWKCNHSSLESHCQPDSPVLAVLSSAECESIDNVTNSSFENISSSSTVNCYLPGFYESTKSGDYRTFLQKTENNQRLDVYPSRMMSNDFYECEVTSDASFQFASYDVFNKETICEENRLLYNNTETYERYSEYVNTFNNDSSNAMSCFSMTNLIFKDLPSTFDISTIPTFETSFNLNF